MGNEEVDLVTVVKPQEKRSLLQKYDIPVEHLSYEYVTQCSNAKELERIVLILRSGEEGIFPDLIKHGEKCLSEISPSSKVLRVEEPVLTRAMLEPEDRKIIDEDIAKWMNEMQGREKDLEEGKALSIAQPIPQPEIRQTPETCVKKSSRSETKRSKQKSIASFDYSGWEKFDADAELDRIDLQDERRQVEAKKAQEKQREKYEEAKKFSRESMVNKLTLTATELSVMAEQEKNIGNEAYRAGDFDEALIRYNSSIAINPNLNAYNNRAITNIKLQRYQEAVQDCNVVLNMEYDNITALMRRGLALENLEKNSEAVIDYQTILRLEPNNKLAIAALNKLRKPSESKKVRMKIEEENVENPVEIKAQSNASKELRNNAEVDTIKRNGISEICFCDRAPGFSRNPKPPPHFKSSYCLSLPGTPTMQKIFGSSKSQNSYFSDVKINESDTKPPKLIIEELPNSESTSRRSFSTNEKNNKSKTDSRSKKKSEDQNASRNSKLHSTNEPEKLKKIEKHHDESGAELKRKMVVGTGQKKIDVASKYEKPASKAIANDNNINKKDFGSVESPYEFLHTWHSLKNDSDLSLRSKLLRSLVPEDLDTVIGNKLDGSMFSTILRCLASDYFTVQNAGLIHRFLTSLTKLSRFSIVHLFMDSDDKKGTNVAPVSRVLEKILSSVEEEISSDAAATLRKAYNM